jgi:predicted RNA-binding Zn-ribbon protein involved in translation (DUF1610 family)
MHANQYSADCWCASMPSVYWEDSNVWMTCSLKIHVPQCQDKFIASQAAKLPAERRALMAAPPRLKDPLPMTASEIDAFNAEMFEYYNGASLCRCAGCGRSFHQDAYERHVKRCPGGSNAAATVHERHPGAGPGADTMPHSAPEALKIAPEEQDPQMDCPHCGAAFSTAAFRNHSKVCTADRPCKPAPHPSATTTTPTPPRKVTDQLQMHGSSNAHDVAVQLAACTMEQEAPALPSAGAGLGSGPGSAGRGDTGSAGSDDPHGSGDGAAGADIQERVPCPTCGRYFAVSALERHARICASSASKKRTAMHMSHQRNAGASVPG